MKLTISFTTDTGVQFIGEASSLVEFDAIRDYLSQQGVGIGAAPASKSPSTAAPAEAAQTQEPAKDVKPAGGKGKGKGDATQETSPASDSKPTAKAAGTAKTAAAPTIEDVVAEMTKIADEFGVPEALILNKRFGVKKAGELKDTQYADYIKFAKHCLADKVAPSGSHAEFDGGSTEADDDVSGLV